MTRPRSRTLAVAALAAALGPACVREAPRPSPEVHKLSSPPPASPAASTPEDRRAAVLRDVADAYRRASEEAQAAYSEGGPGGAPTAVADPERSGKVLAKRMAMEKSLQAKYKAQVAQRHGMTVEELDALTAPSPAAPPSASPR